jgi:hypothetical protein
MPGHQDIGTLGHWDIGTLDKTGSAFLALQRPPGGLAVGREQRRALCLQRPGNKATAFQLGSSTRLARK